MSAVLLDTILIVIIVLFATMVVIFIIFLSSLLLFSTSNLVGSKELVGKFVDHAWPNIKKGARILF